MLQTVEETEDLEQLATRAKAGCLVSFEKIVEQMKNRLFTYLFQMVGNAHDAEDLAQETFVKAYKHLHSFDHRAKLSTWIYSIAKHTALNHIRGRRPLDSIHGMEECLPAADEVEPGERRESVWKLARTLKPSLFELLWLFYAEGFSLKEIARITRTNAVTVRVNLHRARRALKNKYRSACAREPI
jgi:RNA polymerase sigma-70 factor (ECF subfamily)